MQKRSLLVASAASLAIACALGSAPARAQSTGSLDFENSDIVVTGKAQNDIAGIVIPATPKAKQVLTKDVIGRETPGQSIDEIINLIPGVSFQSYDGYGSSGGSLMIRGFDDTRISQTFDGIPLNDTGNYALYTNQQLDPELIEQVNVNLGTTDVDSPTASASGSTVNYRSIDPSHEFGARMVGTVGDYGKMRIFGMINTGDLNSSGTRAWVSASKDTYSALYGGIGKIDKTQFNAKVYQPIGNNGDFITISGHYNVNHNTMASDWALTNTSGIPTNADERDAYTVARCTIPSGTEGVADAASSCGSAWEYRYNPSKTANIRINSRFTLSDKLTLTVDPYFQYTSANGGGTVVAKEGSYSSTIASGYINGTPYFGGVDLNGDGDTLDSVRLSAPSQTETYRIGVIASLRYDLSDNQRVRVAYTYDRGRHRQTGELGYLDSDGFASNYFNTSDALTDVNGNVLQKRDRLSYAILHQVSGEYSGDFASNALHVVAGLRVPFFRRNLTQNCVTYTSTGSVNCLADADSLAAYEAGLTTTYAAPQNKVFDYSRVLPNVGFTYDFTPALSLNANYSKGLQVPGTDNLYTNAFYYSDGSADPKPETTDNFDVGLRYHSGMFQASVAGWYTIFSNRLSSAYNPDTQTSTYTNLGTVDRYGIDGSLAFRPEKHISAYLFGSYLWSKIRDDVQTGTSTYAATSGKMEGGVPRYTVGGRLEGNAGPASLGVEVKKTGSRYYNSLNVAVEDSSGNKLWDAKVPAYTVVNLDARLNLGFLGLNDKTFVQLNVTNLFDKFYYGAFDDAGITNTATTYAYIGAPRTFSASVNFQF